MLVLTSCVDQPSSLISAAVCLTDNGHQLPFGQVQVQVPAAHHRPYHLVDLSRTVLTCQLLQTVLRGRTQRLTGKKAEGCSVKFMEIEYLLT